VPILSELRKSLLKLIKAPSIQNLQMSQPIVLLLTLVKLVSASL
jgi:hypothetical protein